MTKEELKSFRVRFNLSQRDFASEFGISRATVLRWETCKSVIPAWMGYAMRGYALSQSPDFTIE